MLETLVTKISAAFVPAVWVKGSWEYLSTQGSFSFWTARKAEGLHQDPDLLLLILLYFWWNSSQISSGFSGVHPLFLLRNGRQNTACLTARKRPPLCRPKQHSALGVYKGRPFASSHPDACGHQRVCLNQPQLFLGNAASCDWLRTWLLTWAHVGGCHLRSAVSLHHCLCPPASSCFLHCVQQVRK